MDRSHISCGRAFVALVAAALAAPVFAWGSAGPAGAVLTPATCFAAAADDDTEALKKQMQEVLRRNEEMQKEITSLREKVDQLSTAPKPAPAPPPTPPISQEDATRAALDAAVEEALATGRAQAAERKDIAATAVGPVTLRLIDISMVIDTAFGGSTATDSQLLTLQGGDHDPKRRGATLQAAELAIAGAVDPYFDAFASIAYGIDSENGESTVELEEAYMRSTCLPWGLQVKAGLYLTDFGLINPTHPHSWEWLDQPVIATRLLSGEGMRAPGAQLSWLVPVPWYSKVIGGFQNADGGPMASFDSDSETGAVGGWPYDPASVAGLGDLVWSARWENSFDLNEATAFKFGLSGAIGPNATGSSGGTKLYGVDFKLKWHGEGSRGWPYLLWQTELMGRDYDTVGFLDTSDPLNPVPYSSQTLHDYGMYTQLLWGFTEGWGAGFRYEFATGSGESVGGRENDPYRCNRQRFSPLLVWQLSEFSRIRLQYNHDIADDLPSGSADTIWLGVEVLFGAHPAHTY